MRINGLEGNRMYKISCVYRKGEAEVTKTVHVFVSEDEASDQPAANR